MRAYVKVDEIRHRAIEEPVPKISQRATEDEGQSDSLHIGFPVSPQENSDDDQRGK